MSTTPFRLSLSVATAAASVLVLSCALVRGQEDAAEIRRRARDVLEKDSYQRSLDARGNALQGPTSVRPPETDWTRNNEGGSLNAIAVITLWVLIGVFVILAIIGVATMIAERGRVAVHPSHAPPPQEDARSTGRVRPDKSEILGPDQAFGRADELAKDGRFDEAIHALLLGVIHALVPKLGGDRPSLTSRELFRKVELDEPDKRSFGGLVVAVERSLFGGRGVDRFDYSQCRDLAERFLTEARA